MATDQDLTLRSGKGTAGRATSDVSSRKIRVSLKGMAYRNVGSFLLLACRCTSSSDDTHDPLRRLYSRQPQRDASHRLLANTCMRVLYGQGEVLSKSVMTHGGLCQRMLSTVKQRCGFPHRHVAVAGRVVIPPVHEQHRVQGERVRLHLCHDAVRALPTSTRLR